MQMSESARMAASLCAFLFIFTMVSASTQVGFLGSFQSPVVTCRTPRESFCKVG